MGETYPFLYIETKQQSSLQNSAMSYDINYKGGFRGPERLVYSNDGLIYYTKDHYDSFELLYKEEWLW